VTPKMLSGFSIAQGQWYTNSSAVNDAVAICLMFIRVLQAGHNTDGRVFSCGMIRNSATVPGAHKANVERRFEFRGRKQTYIRWDAANNATTPHQRVSPNRSSISSASSRRIRFDVVVNECDHRVRDRRADAVARVRGRNSNHPSLRSGCLASGSIAPLSLKTVPRLRGNL
jgi:hypothetical protein